MNDFKSMKKYACILNYVINSMFEITIKKTYFIENVNLDKRIWFS